MKVKPFGIVILVILLTVCGLPGLNCRQAALAESAPEAKGGGDLRAAVQNPVGAMYSLPLKFTADFGAGDGSAYFFNINPVIPVTVGDWNLINRALIPAVVSVDGKIQGTPGIPGWGISIIPCLFRRPMPPSSSGESGRPSICRQPRRMHSAAADGVRVPLGWFRFSPVGIR